MQSRTQTSTGSPIKTLEMQQAEELAMQQQYQQYMAQQAAMQSQQTPQPLPPPQGGTPGNFPGSAPGAPSDGLLGETYRNIRNFFTPDKKLGEMVPASDNPLMHSEGVGIGGEARRRQLEEQERRALEGQMQRQR